LRKCQIAFSTLRGKVGWEGSLEKMRRD